MPSLFNDSNSDLRPVGRWQWFREGLDIYEAIAAEAATRGLLAPQRRWNVELLPMPTSRRRGDYRAELRPYWERAVRAIARKKFLLKSFRLSQLSMPPDSFFERKIVPILEKHSNRHEYYGNLKCLELSNCKMANDDVFALARFLRNNGTLEELDLSNNKIENTDRGRAAKLLAMSIKTPFT